MRVIQLTVAEQGHRGRRRLLAAGLLATGVAATLMIGTGLRGLPAVAILALAAAAALGIGVGLAVALAGAGARAWRREHAQLAALLGPVFDDSYALLLGSRLPGVPRGLAGLLVGPAGVRALLVRDWRGRYRVRGRHWEYDTRGVRGWITCRTNPSYEAALVRDAVARWATQMGVDQNLPIEGAIVFPGAHSQLVLEEPDSEIVTTENGPWWAQRIGRVQRLEATRAARFTEAVVEASRAAGQKRAAARRRDAI